MRALSSNRIWTTTAAAILCAAPGAIAGDPPEGEGAEPAALAADRPAGWTWNAVKGLSHVSADGERTLKVFGRVQNDWAFHSADDAIVADKGPFIDGTEFRRARLGVSGTLYENVGYKAEYDFAGGDADFKDVFMTLADVGPGSVKVGHFKEPFSLEELTSSKYLTFLERSLPNAFAPSRNTGASLYGDTDDVTWAVGVFRATDGFGNDVNSGSDAEYAATGRITYAPIYEEDGAKVVHVGAAYSARSAENGSVRFRSSPEDHQAPRVADSGTFAADGFDLLGVEAAWVHGALSLQAELIQATVDAAAGGDPDLTGFYVYASWFLTEGDHRNYKKSAGAFDRVSPRANWGPDGVGAWELVARFSSLDLTDSGLAGGELDDVTLGVNWYLNPHTRVMLDYVTGELTDDTSQGDIDALLLRFQVDF